MDDIEDGSKLRRGIPVAHDVFGVPTTINTANYVYFLALERLASKRHANSSSSALRLAHLMNQFTFLLHSVREELSIVLTPQFSRVHVMVGIGATCWGAHGP